MDGMHGWEIRELYLSCCMTINKIKVACQDSGAMEDQDVSYLAYYDKLSVMSCQECSMKPVVIHESLSLCLYLNRD